MISSVRAWRSLSIQLTADEFANLKFQFGTSSCGALESGIVQETLALITWPDIMSLRPEEIGDLKTQPVPEEISDLRSQTVTSNSGTNCRSSPTFAAVAANLMELRYGW